MRFALCCLVALACGCDRTDISDARALPAAAPAYWGELRALLAATPLAWATIDASRLRGDRDIGPLLTMFLTPGDPISDALLGADEVAFAVLDAAAEQRVTLIRGPLDEAALRLTLTSDAVLGGGPFTAAPTARGTVYTRGGSSQAIGVAAPNVLIVGDVTSVLAAMAIGPTPGAPTSAPESGDLRATIELPTLARAAVAAAAPDDVAALVRATRRLDLRVVLGNGIDLRAELALEPGTSPASAAAAIAALARAGLGAVGYSVEQVDALLDGAAVVLTEADGMPGVVLEVTVPRIAAVPLLESLLLADIADGSTPLDEPEGSQGR